MITDSFSGSLSTGFLYTRQAPKYVFYGYKWALGKNEITSQDYNDNNIHVTLVTNTIADELKPCITDVYLNYGSLSAKFGDRMVNTGILLHDNEIKSSNIDTSEESEITYQSMFNTPCSAVLGNPTVYQENIKDCLIKNDSEYKVWATNKNDRFARNHMSLTYHFDTAYNQTEYDAFNVTEDYALENGVYLAASNFTNINTYAAEHSNKVYEQQGIEQKSIMTQGCLGIILSYQDSKHTGHNMIPMMYYEFEKPVYSNNNTLNIEWNTNGILRVE